MRDRVAALSALVLVATLAGCASIPTSGGVQQGPARQDQQVDLDVLVDGPQKGATQAQILQGFIDAAASPRNNYQVAREFLTDALAAEWQADAGGTVDVLADRAMAALD
ncbi:MAG TPA: hypothetical protein VKA62_01720, partial [Agromyces sp.]|nr:hypothetical protein [Agromyces sp.]